MSSKKERNRRIIIFCLLIVILLFSVGYATLAKSFNVSPSSNINANWNIEIVDIESTSIIGSATNSFEPKVLPSTSASFGINLVKPNDSITYKIRIKNKGTIDAYLSGITVSENNINESKNMIKYSIFGVTSGKTLLPVDSENIIYLKIYYNDIDNNLSSQTKNYVINFIYEQKKD